MGCERGRGEEEGKEVKDKEEEEEKEAGGGGRCEEEGTREARTCCVDCSYLENGEKRISFYSSMNTHNISVFIHEGDGRLLLLLRCMKPL
jgi:hypothetical protein